MSSCNMLPLDLFLYIIALGCGMMVPILLAHICRELLDQWSIKK